MRLLNLSGDTSRLCTLLLVLICGMTIPGVITPGYAQETDTTAVEAVESMADPEFPIEAEAQPLIVNKGDVAWMMTATLLVLLMVLPGLALFYGGMVRSKNVLSTLMQVVSVFSLLVILWISYGYSLAFTEGGALIGSFDKVLLRGVNIDSIIETFSDGIGLPEYLFIAFQSTFAGITGALIVGAFAERARFGAVMIFSVIWFTFGYLPIAHMVWGPGGLLGEMGVLDFAGGTVVHINAGVAGLIGAYLVGTRKGFGEQVLKPHNITLTFMGASLLWVGWFGFNAGSNLEATAGAVLPFLNTILATAAAILVWAGVEKAVRGKSSALGVACGIVAGLVGITPACGSVGPFGAIVIGGLSGAICFWAVTALKTRIKADDTLDVFGVHGVAGIVGAILTGVFAAPALGGVEGPEFSIISQVGLQTLGVVITIVWITIVSLLAFWIAGKIFGLRVSEEEEEGGLDMAFHGELAYEN